MGNRQNIFLESLSAINQTIGEVLYGIAVVALTAVVEWLRDKESNIAQKVLQLFGVGVFVAIGVWGIVFLFKVLIGVPLAINRENVRVSAPIAKLNPVPLGWDARTRKVQSVSIGTKPAARLGIGLDKYKEISSEQIGKWVIAESETIADLAVKYRKRVEDAAKPEGKSTPGTEQFNFTMDFKDCCLQAVRELRTEALVRLGPIYSDTDEDRSFSDIRKYPASGMLSPWGIADYAEYFRRLGVRCLRLDVPRKKPVLLKLSKPITFATKIPQLPNGETVEIKIPSVISSGYLVIETREPGAAFRPTGEFESVDWKFIDNKALRDYLNQRISPNPIRAEAYRIRNTPLNPNSKVRVTVHGRQNVRILSATIFDE